MTQIGLGVLINSLRGNEETVNAINVSLGKVIKEIELDNNNRLNLLFEDNTKLQIWDDGQSCCEHRFMTTDDNLSEYVGGIFKDIELKSAPKQEGKYGEQLKQKENEN